MDNEVSGGAIVTATRTPKNFILHKQVILLDIATFDSLSEEDQKSIAKSDITYLLNEHYGTLGSEPFAD